MYLVKIGAMGRLVEFKVVDKMHNMAIYDG